jgi:hypothetical protein
MPEKVRRAVDLLRERFGEGAYCEALARAESAHLYNSRLEEDFWRRVAEALSPAKASRLPIY